MICQITTAFMFSNMDQAKEGVDILRLHEHLKSAFQHRYRSSTASRTLCYARSYMIIVTTLRIFLISERDISFDSFDQVGVHEGQ